MIPRTLLLADDADDGQDIPILPSYLGSISRLENFDPAEPIHLFGNRTIEDPLSGIRVSAPVAGPGQLTAAETYCLLEHLRGCSWREDFESGLTEFGKNGNGDVLLAGHLPLATFTDFVTQATGRVELQELLRRLRILIAPWGALGVEDVQFVGIQRPAGEDQPAPANAGREARPTDENPTPPADAGRESRPSGEQPPPGCAGRT